MIVHALKIKEENPPYTIQCITHPHDTFFKMAMGNQNVAREFFEGHLPPDVLRAVNLDKLELQPGSFIDDNRNHFIADMLFKTEMNNYTAYLYLVVDHQSKPDKMMPFRIFRYIYNVQQKHVDENGDNKIPLVVPLVVYHGREPWSYSTDLKTLVDAPQELVDAWFLKPFLLIDLNRIEDEVLKKKIWAGTMEMTLKHIFAKDMQPHLAALLQLLKSLGSQPPTGPDFVKTVLRYILDCGEVGDKELFFESAVIELSKETGASAMTIAEQLRAEGRAEGWARGQMEGLEKGIKLGEEKKMKELVERLLAETSDIALIAKITNLSEKEILNFNKSH